MSKITLNNVGSLIDATTAAATINANSATIQTAFDNTLSRDGTTPNTMGNNLDMNSNQIINLPAPSSVNSPARLIDVVSNPTIVIPGTGTSGHVVPFLDGNNTFSGTNAFGTISATSATFTSPIVIPANSVANASLGTMAANTVKGSIAGGTPADLSKTQLTTLINTVTSSLPGTITAFPNNTTTFFRGDGTYAIPVQTYQFLETLTASTSSTLSSAASWAGYSSIEFVFLNIIPVSNAVTLQMQLTAGTLQTTGYGGTTFGVAGNTTITAQSPTTFIAMNSATVAASTTFSGIVRLINPSNTTSLKHVTGTTNNSISANSSSVVGGVLNNTTAVTGATFSMSAGNIASGTIKIYGIV